MQLSAVVRYWMQFNAVEDTRLLPPCSPNPGPVTLASPRRLGAPLRHVFVEQHEADV